MQVISYQHKLLLNIQVSSEPLFKFVQESQALLIELSALLTDNYKQTILSYKCSKHFVQSSVMLVCKQH